MLIQTLKNLASDWLPLPVHRMVRRVQIALASPPIGQVEFGQLRRTEPISRAFGYDRGLPIDRYYIEGFLAAHSHEIRGRVLEIGENTYTKRFGSEYVEQSDVLFPSSNLPAATIIADLADGANIPSDTFDCILCTQTLHVIYDYRAAIATLHRILKPGGILLATLPVNSQLCYSEGNRWGDYWRFTRLAAEKLFEDMFPDGDVQVQAYGSVLTITGFLYGLSSDDLTPSELNHHDLDYQLCVSVRAVKASA